MRCLHPLDVRYKVNGKPTNSFHLVPCGKCYACLHNKQQDWIIRMQNELKMCSQAVFITLTYSDSCLHFTSQNHPTLHKPDLVAFLKRLRAYLPQRSVRFFACGEYGTHTLRPHYHAILFFRGSVDIKLEEYCLKCWNNGFCYFGSVTPESMAYVAKYVFKGSRFYEDCEKPFLNMSRRPGLGSDYCDNERIQAYHDYNPYIVDSGYKKRLPRYYMHKLGIVPDKSKSKSFEDTYKRLYPEDVGLENYYFWLHDVIAQNELNFENRLRAKEKF